MIETREMTPTENLERMVDDLRAMSTYIDKAIKPLMDADGDGCEGCAFISVEEWEMPCAKCKRNCKDYWRAKE